MNRTNQILSLNSEGYSNSEIANIVNCSAANVGNCLKRNGVKKVNKSDRLVLNTNQKEIIIGILLGDAYLGLAHKKHKNPRLSFSHSIKQEEYLNFLVKNLNIKGLIKSGKATCKGKKYDIVTYVSKSYSAFNEFFNCFYKPKKIIPMNLVFKYFTSQSLAYLIQDDGCYDKSGRHYKISTDSFTKEEQLAFIDFLKNKFGIISTIRKSRNNKFHIAFSTKSTELVVNLISPYISKSMSYKLPKGRL